MVADLAHKLGLIKQARHHGGSKTLKKRRHSQKLSKVSKKITRFGYIIEKNALDQGTLNTIRNGLTVKPQKFGAFAAFGKSKDTSFPLYIEDDKYIGIPKYYGTELLGKPDLNRLEVYAYPTHDMNYIGTLRPHQTTIVNKILCGLDKHRGGLLIAGCGSGKTNMAIYIACHYQLKTLFITHKTFIKNQIINRIISTTNIKKVGIIQRKRVEIDHPFVVGMVQSLCKINYDDTLFRDFGMIIIDEVHHMGARNFSKVYQKMSAKYMLGISAERTRPDGLYKIINWYMGPILHAEEQKPNDMVVVKTYHYLSQNTARTKLIINKYTKEPDRSTMITNLIYIKKRNRFILRLILELFDQGKNILCLSGRLKQINLLYQLLHDNEYYKRHVGKYIGEMTEANLAKSATKQIILGTYNMAQEGLDIENLNVVIMCTPRSAIKQSIGRILRKEIYEEHPIVIDIVDDSNAIFRRQYQIRTRYYRQQNYNIQDFKVSDYEVETYQSYDDAGFISQSIKSVPNKRSIQTRQYHQRAINVDEFEIS